MKSNFYGNRKSLLAVFICAAFLSEVMLLMR